MDLCGTENTPSDLDDSAEATIAWYRELERPVTDPATVADLKPILLALLKKQ